MRFALECNRVSELTDNYVRITAPGGTGPLRPSNVKLSSDVSQRKRVKDAPPSVSTVLTLGEGAAHIKQSTLKYDFPRNGVQTCGNT